MTDMNPTNETYDTLNAAYSFFNKELFNGKLPTCLITMQRNGKSRGYFCAERFQVRKSDKPFKIHEIAINPHHFDDRTDEEIISTLVHEMCHLWQQEYGEPPRRNYHDREWAEQMKVIGLMPSNTGEEGGRITGQSMTHYILKNGKYDQLIKKFFTDHKPLQYEDSPELEIARAKKKNKVKYTCPKCYLNAWGKPGISILCGTDKAELEVGLL